MESRTRINPVVFFGSSACVIALALWAIISPRRALTGPSGLLVGWISNWFGWFYILIATVFLAFIIFLALSPVRQDKAGSGAFQTRLQHLLLGFAMLFAAGIGTDVMFFSVAEPVTLSISPRPPARVRH